MISLDIKSDLKILSPISVAFESAKDKMSLSFSDLLKSVSLKDEKGIEETAFVLSLDLELKKDSPLPSTRLSLKKEDLASLLKEDVISSKDDVKVLLLNPDIRKDLPIEKLKILIVESKQFLKKKILQSEGFKEAETKELPRTLKGLVQMAKKFGIELSKITVEEVQETNKVRPLTKEIQETTKATPLVKENVQVDIQTKNIRKNEFDNSDVIEVEKLKIPKNKNVKLQNQIEIIQEVKIKDDIKLDDKKLEILKEVKLTPLFKAQEKTTLSTEQIVQTKQFKVEDKITSKTKADETLKLLLRGERPSLELGNITKDFSVATAKVILPSALTEAAKSLDSLFKGDVEESTQKLDALFTHKADSFEVKLNEAKQMIKYLSQDVKTAIEDYKAPFTRIKVQLNPQKLGEVEVTIVQRGKNLHINISSNTAAINTLAINVNELKAQLSTNGINNASLNFNNSSQNTEQQNAQQQQSRHNERRADEEYNYFEDDELNEEILSSLEIVVPNYA